MLVVSAETFVHVNSLECIYILDRASKFFRSFDKYVRTFFGNVTVFTLFKCMTERENDGELRRQWKINTRDLP